jgi:hypothetical protein
MNSATSTVARSPDELIVLGRAQKALVWGIAALVVAILAVLSCNDWWRHRLTPKPEGLVVQFELREDQALFSRFVFLAVDRNGPAVAILENCESPHPLSPKVRPTITFVRYPSGEVLEQWVEPSEALRQELLNSRPASTGFDFDCDGVEDATEWNIDGWVRVRSGVDGRELWSNHDLLEYESKDRLTPLGDLDGDGFAEIAVLHPRQDRSTYDWQLFDRAFGAKSWLSIVSGSRVSRR